jgi:hypothetical protein
MAAAAQHAPGSAATPVRLFIECHNLLDKDTFSKSDPFCCLRMKSADQPAFQEIGRTEVRVFIFYHSASCNTRDFMPVYDKRVAF